VEIYFGGGPGERLQGTVLGSAEDISSSYEYKGRKDYINANKILAAWEI
jgi:hypothetical protein